MMLNGVVFNYGTTMCQITKSTDYFWWFWAVFYPILLATVITCFLRKYSQWSWTMYGYTQIVCVRLYDGVTGLLLNFLCFFYTCIFVLYFVLNEACYESTGGHAPIDEMYLKSSSFSMCIE